MARKNKLLHSTFVLFFTLCLAGLNPGTISMKPRAVQPDSPVAEHSSHSEDHHQGKENEGHGPAGKNPHGDCAGHVGMVSSCCMSAALPKAFPVLSSFGLHVAIFSNYLFTLLSGFTAPPFHPPIPA